MRKQPRASIQATLERATRWAPWAIAGIGAALFVAGLACATIGYAMAADANDQVRQAQTQQTRIIEQLDDAIGRAETWKALVVGPRAPRVLIPCELDPEPSVFPLALGMGGP